MFSLAAKEAEECSMLVQPVEKIIHKSNSTERFKNILRHEL